MVINDYYGNQFKWFTGVVKEIADNDRVKVRIFGVHRIEDTTNVSDGDLPLAMVMYPVTSSGGGHALTPGKYVVGFFADGDDCQQPIVVGVFKGGEGASDNSSTGSAVSPGAAGPATESGTPGTNSGQTSQSTETPSDLKGGSNSQKVYNFVRERIESSGKSGGDMHAQASAVVSAMNAESGCNPRAATMDTNGWPSKGLCQWNKERLWELERRYGESSSQQNKSTAPLNCTMEQQLAYFWDDINKEKRAYNMLMSSTNAAEATDAMIAFERPGGVWAKMPDGKYGVNRGHPEFQKRLKGTMDAMSKMKYEGRGKG